MTNESGDFVVRQRVADTYTIEVSMTASRPPSGPGIAVSPGDRARVGTLTLEVGGATETVVVKGETPQITRNSGERSFTVTTDAVTNLPIATRNFADLLNLTPGVSTAPSRDSAAAAANNFMMDGVSTMEPGATG